MRAAEVFANKDRAAAIVRLLEAEGRLPASSVWAETVSNSSRSKHIADHLDPFIIREQRARNRDSEYELRVDIRSALQRAADALDHLVFVAAPTRSVAVSLGEDGGFVVDGEPTDGKRLAAVIKRVLHNG